MSATEVLKHEHQIISLVLDAAEREAMAMQAQGTVDAEKVAKMVSFFRNFADRCHHAKEEDLLFVWMGERGMSTQAGPIAVMLQEHDQGRAHLQAIDAVLSAAAGDDRARATVQQHLLGYVRLLRDHIHKEDTILYPMADQVFSEEDQARLMEEFDRVEAEEMGEGVHEQYHQLAHELIEG